MLTPVNQIMQLTNAAAQPIDYLVLNQNAAKICPSCNLQLRELVRYTPIITIDPPNIPCTEK